MIRSLHLAASMALVLLTSGLVHAQKNRIDTLLLPFRALTIEDGLSQGMVNTILQDKYGFMWFGTKDGLNRYDGYTFTVFRQDPEDSTTLRNNYIHSLYEDKQGRLWVGTGEGLELFDRDSERFIHARAGSTPIRDIVLGIAQDAHNDLWLARNNGLAKLTFTGKTSSDGMPPCTIKRYLENSCLVSSDRAGTIWASQYDLNSFHVLPNHAGNDVLDTLQLDRPVGNTSTGRSPLALTGLTTIEDTVNRKLYGLHMFGIAQLDGHSHRATSLLEVGTELGQMRGTNAAVDPNGRLWLAIHSGIYLFDPATRKFSRALPRDQNLMLQAQGGAKCAYRDRNGLIWIGTSGYGLVTYDPRSGRFNTVKTASCGSMQALPDGRVSVAYHAGFLNVFDPATNAWPTWIPWSEKVDDPALDMLSRANRVFVRDERGIYWFNHEGILTYDPVQDRITRVARDTAAIRAFPEETYNETFLLEGDSLIWSGSAQTLCRFDRRTGLFHYVPYPRSRLGDSERFLHAIDRDDNGILWLGTATGLYCYDRRKNGVARWLVYTHDPSDPASLSSDIIYSLLNDPKDPEVLWVGTNGGGLNRLHKRTGKFVRYNSKHGLPNDVVYGILPDEAGNLWMSTNKGLSRFSPGTGAFRNFDASVGLQSDEFNRYAYCRQSDGTLFFGGVMGFNYFKPAELTDDSTNSPIRVTGIKLINGTLDHRAEGSPLDRPAYLSEGITIPHSANMVTFEFATLEFSAPEEHRYQYKLEGFDGDWIIAGHDRSAVYTNLDPGTYTFRVRGDNRDGIWDTQGTAFQLVVLPPWWRTWWAYGLYLFALVGGVLLFIRIRTVGLNRQKEMLERTVAERTAALHREKEEADRQRERAEHSGKIKQQFLANMSHEIRTPMNAIMGMTGILRRNAHLPEQEKYLDAIAKSSESLLVIINDVLDLSKMEAGKIVLGSVRFDPRAVVQGVQEILRFKAEDKKLYLRMDIDPMVPGSLQGDPTRLQQIIMNLVGNAIKFTTEGGVSVNMTATMVDHAKALVRINVTDTGIGVATDRRDRIFEEFDQGQGSTAFKYGGTGLGLSISRRLAQMQGGDITVTSEIGKGSTFTVSIPFALAKDAEIPHGQDPGVPSGTRPDGSLRDLRILLAEDNEFNAMVAQDELADAIPGVQVDVAVNGRIAVEMVQANDYDLVLMDVQMPEMNGHEATRAIRALDGAKSRIPIIAITANVLKEEVERCKESGMDGYVPKPFRREELVNAIATATNETLRGS
ncbi:MAG: response regulator [Flavobacteriales bacterium]|nr:response regulator [Flavobacteriales bacterium]